MRPTRWLAGAALAVAISCTAAASTELSAIARETRLVWSSVEQQDFFGHAVGIDRDVIVVGAFGTYGLRGSVFIYERVGSEWIERQEMTFGPNVGQVLFGYDVVIQGTTIAVSATRGKGSVHVYDRVESGLWLPVTTLRAPDAGSNDSLGRSIAMSGDTLIAGSWIHRHDVVGQGAVYVWERGPSGAWQFAQELLASDAEEFQFFGNEVAMSEDTILASAFGGTRTDRVYVFERDGVGWAETQVLLPSGDNPFFTGTMAVGGDVAVVPPNYVFERIGGVWTETGRLLREDGLEFDSFDDMTTDGTQILAGDRGADGADRITGAVFRFAKQNGRWELIEKLFARSGERREQFSVSDVADGRIVVGADHADDRGVQTGAVYVFEGPGCEPAPALDDTCSIPASERKFSESNPPGGFGVALSAADDLVVGGSPREFRLGVGLSAGAAYVLRDGPAGWNIEQMLAASDAGAFDAFGFSVSTDGTRVVVGANNDDDRVFNAGAAYVFVLDGTAWVEEAKLVDPAGGRMDHAGTSVSVWGDWAAVGAPGNDGAGVDAGAVLLYRHDGSGWVFEQKVTGLDTAAGDEFGIDVSLSGDALAVGAWFDDDGGRSSGSVYVFRRSGVVWSQEAKLTAGDASIADILGFDVALDGDTLIAGASHADGAGTDSGAAYVFVRESPAAGGDVWTQQAKLTASDAGARDEFGRGVDVKGAAALVGAFRDDDVAGDAGAAYSFRRRGSVWSEERKFVAGDGGPFDELGLAVAVLGRPSPIAPVANAGPDRAVECGSPDAGTIAMLDGRQSVGGSREVVYVAGAHKDDDRGVNAGAVYLFDGSDLVYDWSGPGVVVAEPACADPEALLPIGTTTVELTLSDGLFESRDTVDITVADTLPPTVAIWSVSNGRCYGPSEIPLDLAWFVEDCCDPGPYASRTEGDSPPFEEHGDHTVTVFARDGAGLEGSDTATFTIDRIAPSAEFLPRPEPEPSVPPQELLLSEGIVTSDDDGATGGVESEKIFLDGCLILDGRTLGDRDGLLNDEVLPLDESGPNSVFCQAFRRCGTRIWEDAVLRLDASDCGGNVGSGELVIEGTRQVTADACD